MKKKLSGKKFYTHDEVVDHFIGKRGTAKRERFEFELQIARVGDGIRQLRRKRNLTQEQLGEMIGVQKAQISKLENNAANMTLETVLRVFSALKAEISFKIEPR